MDRKVKINAWYIVAAVAGLLLVQSVYQRSKQVTTIPYSRFEMLLDQNKIDKIWISQNSIEGTLKQPENGVKDFATTRVDPDLSTSIT
jgi:cell division protease FtsH